LDESILLGNKHVSASQNLSLAGLCSVFHANERTFTSTLISKLGSIKLGYLLLLIWFVFPIL
jgi:hypothetical protein